MHSIHLGLQLKDMKQRTLHTVRYEWLMYCDVESKWKNYRIITFPGQALRNSYLNISVMELDHLLTRSGLTRFQILFKGMPRFLLPVGE